MFRTGEGVYMLGHMQGKACVALSRLFRYYSGAQKDNRKPGC